MTKPRVLVRVLRTLLIVVISIVALGLAFTYLVRPALTGPIASITFDQSAPIPNFDGSEYTVTDDDRLAEFADLINKHNALPELVTLSTIVPAGAGCVGGTTTHATITFESGREADLRLEQQCGENEPYGEFRDEATSLLNSWKDPGSIRSLTFEQSKAVDGFDDSSYTITDVDRLAEFSALLEEHNISPLLLDVQYHEPSDCDGGTSTSLAVEYGDGHVAEAVLEPSCDGSGDNAEFLDEATELLTSWKDD